MGAPSTDGPAPAGESAALRWGFATAALVAVALFAWFVVEVRRALPPPAPDVGDAATVLPAPKPLPEFALVDDTGAAFDRARLEGRWSFLFFGYSHCPSICPLALADMGRIHGLLEDDPAAQMPDFVFVSVDPERDAPGDLRRYVDHFEPSFTGVTGDMDQLRRLTAALGVYHERAAGGTEETYDFDHTASLLLVDPQARLHAVFSPPIEPEASARAFREIRRLGAEG